MMEARTMKRARLWEISCAARDAVLWTSFTWEELRQVANRMGFALEDPATRGLPDPAPAIMAAVHRTCDERNDFSDRVEEILRESHERTVRHVGSTPPEEVIPWLGMDLDRLPVPLAGLIWAVVTDPRPPMRALQRGLLWRLSVEGLRAIAFGRVELIEV
jgi:hypothetical protein